MSENKILKHYIEGLIKKFGSIPDDRKQLLKKNSY